MKTVLMQFILLLIREALKKFERAWWSRSHIQWKITLKKKTFQKNIIFSVYTCNE